MMIKLKSLIVIILSSIVISGVILLTIFGLSFYMGIREGESARLHKINVASLNAELYQQHIKIQDLRAKYEKENIYKGKYVLEGTIKNTGYRTVSSARLKVGFLNSSGETIHREVFFPLKASSPPRAKTIAALSIFTSGKEISLLPGQYLHFKHILTSQKKKDIISPIKYKKYATNPDEWSGKFSSEITAIKF